MIVILLLMLLQCLRINPMEDVFSMTYLVLGAVGNQDELVGLQRCLVLHRSTIPRKRRSGQRFSYFALDPEETDPPGSSL